MFGADQLIGSRDGETWGEMGRDTNRPVDWQQVRHGERWGEMGRDGERWGRHVGRLLADQLIGSRCDMARQARLMLVSLPGRTKPTSKSGLPVVEGVHGLPCVLTVED